jgi:hypothetical protein
VEGQARCWRGGAWCGRLGGLRWGWVRLGLAGPGAAGEVWLGWAGRVRFRHGLAGMVSSGEVAQG